MHNAVVSSTPLLAHRPDFRVYQHNFEIGTAVARLRTGQPGFDSRQGLGLFSPLHRVQIGSGAHPTFCLMGTGVLPRG